MTDHETSMPTCRWCGRDVERIASGRWASGRPMYRHADTLQPKCYVFGSDDLADVEGEPDVD